MPPNTAPETFGTACEHEPHHHPAPSGMTRVNSYWKENPHEAGANDDYWQDPSAAHGKHTAAPKEDEEKHVPTHHPVQEGMKRVNSYWNEQKHNANETETYWNDPASAHNGVAPTAESSSAGQPTHHPIEPGMPRVGSLSEI